MFGLYHYNNLLVVLQEEAALDPNWDETSLKDFMVDDVDVRLVFDVDTI